MAYASQHHLQIETDASCGTGPCECCGHESRLVSGFVKKAGAPYALYFVHWTIDHVAQYGANFDLIFGLRNEGGGAQPGTAASLLFRLENGGSFMVIDADDREFTKDEFAGRALRREDVVGKPIAHERFALCDAIVMQDERLVALGTNAEVWNG